jgi:tetratricopeptide (TPR) repeat protein
MSKTMAEKKVKRTRSPIKQLQSSENIETPVLEVEIDEEVLVEEVGDSEPTLVSVRTGVWEKIGRFCLFAAAFLVPLFFLPATQSPVETNKFAAIGFLMLVAFVSFLACVIERRKLEYPRSLLSLAILSFLLITGVSTYFSISRVQSLYGYLRQPDSFMSIAISALAFFLSFYFFRKDDIKKLGALVIASFVIATFSSLLQIFNIFIFPWDFARTAAFNVVGSPFAWGICMAAIIAAVGAAELGAAAPRKRQLLVSIIILMTLGLAALNYQFLWISLAVVMSIIASVRFVSREHFKLPLVMVAVALFFALAGSHIPSFGNVPPEIRPGGSPTLSVGMSSIKGLRILTGTGPATFNLDFARYRPASLNLSGFWNMPFFQGYSYAFTLVATSGILGFLALLFILACAASYLMGYGEHQYVTMLLSGVLFLFVSLFFYPAFFAELFLIFIGLGQILPESVRREAVFEEDSRWKSFLIFIAALACIAASFAAAYHVGQKYVAALDFAHASEFFSAGKNDAGLTDMNSALTLDTQSDEYLRGATQIFIAEAGQALQAGGASSSTLIQSDVTSALQAAQNAVAIGPNDVNNILNLAGVYESIIPLARGADQAAASWYQKAMELDPSNPQIPVFAARAEIAAGDPLAGDPAESALQKQTYADAENLLKKSIDLKSDYTAPRFLLAQLYLKQGNITQAIQRVEEIKTISPFDAGVAFQLGLLYYQNNQIDKAQVEFERSVSIDQNYSNARYFLGLIYDKVGQHSQALDQFQKILALNPDNADVKTIIANIQAGKSPLPGAASSSTAPEKPNQ